MISNTPWEPITKPISVWNKPLNIDFKEFFKSISGVVIHGTVGKWDDAAKDLVDALAAVGLESDAGQLAWLLIRRALNLAVLDLVKENANQLAVNAPKNPDAFCETLDLSLESVTMTIDGSFFEHPSGLPVLDAFKVPFKQWLMGYGLTEAQSDTIAARLPSYFVFALNHEWRHRPQVYAPIKEAIETPFTKAGEREQGWIYYSAWLQKQVNESIFGETFSLDQIYVPLRAYYVSDVKDSDHTLADTKRSKQTVIDLEAELDAWVNRSDRGDAVRVISGGPGSGKSSFTKMYAAHQSHNAQLRVLYIPLHQFDPKNDLVSSVHEFVRFARLLPHNPLDPEIGERLLIIFDGLDELAMQGKVGAETAREFIDVVDQTVNHYNYREMRLQILLTGREVVVQANVSKFRKPTQVLHALPYFLSEGERKDYVDPHALLATDQRQAWWGRYGAATGRDFERMPDELGQHDLDEITTQPLLNYLVALSYVRGELDFSSQINLNEIYEDLLKAVYERDYAGGRHRAVRDLAFEHFIRILEEIGLATWHGDGRTTTISEVHKQCTRAGLSPLLEVFQEGAEAGVARLLTAFYFRQHEGHREGERTFEFTHKSFGEYLTSRRIVRALERIQNELERRKTNLDSGWDERDALKHWAELYGDAPPMTQDLYRFVKSEVSLKDASIVGEWQTMIGNLISWMLQFGMPMELLDPRPKYHKELQAARNTEEALLAMIYACATVTRQISQIRWLNESHMAAGVWLSKLHGQRSGEGNSLVMDCLGFLDLRGCILYVKDLLLANLYHADLQGIQLAQANLLRANLSETKLDGANFYQAKLSDADLSGASLQDANLNMANLNGAKLSGANLSGANLSGANLNGAKLNMANLNGAKLNGANLEEANLSGAKLSGANLNGANLSGANLNGANLNGANLEEANLPNGELWTPDTDMAYFTDPEHPQF